MPTKGTQPAAMLPPTAGIDRPWIRTMARATTGDAEAIERLAADSDGSYAVVQNRLAPLLASLGYERGLAIPNRWQEIMRQTAITRMLLENALSDLGETLDDANIPWLPLKGMGPVARLYPAPECRPTSDLDVLIHEDRFLETRELLRRRGWEDLHPGPVHEDFLLREGYNWQARHTSGVMLELHFRLWGPVDPALPAALLEAARPALALGAMARLSRPAESYVAAACHLWNSPIPVAMLYFLDLHLLTQTADDDHAFAEAVIAMGRRHDLQLFVGLAAAITATLWPAEADGHIASSLLAELRFPERILVSLTRNRSPMATPLGALVLPRLLSGRKSRTGWRAPFRKLWPHPAMFQGSTARGPLAMLRRTLTRNR